MCTDKSLHSVHMCTANCYLYSLLPPYSQDCSAPSALCHPLGPHTDLRSDAAWT